MRGEAERLDPAGIKSQWGVARKEEALVGSKEARNGLQPEDGNFVESASGLLIADRRFAPTPETVEAERQ